MGRCVVGGSRWGGVGVECGRGRGGAVERTVRSLAYNGSTASRAVGKTTACNLSRFRRAPEMNYPKLMFKESRES